MKYEKYEEGQQLADLSKTDYTEIGAKAFLSCKTVEKLVLPEKTERIGDWAFSHAKRLREITVPLKNIELGKQVFLGLNCLEKISFLKDSGNNIYEGIPYFMASLFRCFENKSVWELEGLEGRQMEWLTNYDEMLADYLKRPADADFKPVFIGWFDVEDIDSQLERHIANTETEKLELIFQRLWFDKNLKEQIREAMYEYICGKEMQLRSLFCDKNKPYCDEIQYYKLWEKAGGLTEHVAAGLLEEAAVTDAEIRAYLLKIQLDKEKNTDFFDDLLL